ncbi:MAG: hypothetical protein LBU18_02665 [Treponema sp.]|jgi:hypothetical protein|nr:hypothetical protein [Treponema sp.]
MESNKKPSIYYDRSTFGSLEELDDYGVWVKSEPQDLSLAKTNALETTGPEHDSSREQFLEPTDFDAPENKTWLTGVSTDMTDIADFNIASADASASLEDTLPPDNWQKKSMASAGNVSKPELEKEDLSALQKASEETNGAEDISTRLLLKIAHELSAIKNEIFSLKEELRRGNNIAVEPVKQNNSGGFFDEEDDGKIALTGDELNNILNKTDFTGESEDNFSDKGPDAEFSDITEVEDESPKAAWENFLTDDDAFTFSGADVKTSPELEQLMEEGVEPMTPAPEDTSFLEDDPEIADLSEADLSEADESAELPAVDFSEDISFGSSFDLDGASTGEPDLIGELTEASDEIPFIEELAPDDLSIELDMEVPHAEGETNISGGSENDGGNYEEIELSLDDSSSPDGFEDGELSGGISLDDSFLNAGISLDDIILPENEAPNTTYDQVIPEGFNEESEDGHPAEEDSPEVDFTEEETTAYSSTGSKDADAVPGEAADEIETISPDFREELRSVLSYMDQLLESLPEEKIEEFAKSEQFNTYKKLFEELGLA